MYNIQTMKRVNYHLTEAEITRLQALSNKTGLSVAEIIRRAIDEYLDRKERKNMEKEGEEEVSEPSPQGHEFAPHGWKDGMMPTRKLIYH